MLQEILRWEFGDGDAYKSTLAKWENLIMEYERNVGENIKEYMKCAILIGGIPKDIRHIMQVTQIKIPTTRSCGRS